MLACDNKKITEDPFLNFDSSSFNTAKTEINPTFK